MRIFLIAGSPFAQRPSSLAPGPGDRVIAADYGGHHALAWGWPVDLLIGDLDSLPQAELQVLRARGIPTIVAPAAKDETDLELALACALTDGARQIVICGALGGRADHMLANVLLLARSELAEVETIMVDGAQTLRLLRGGAGQEGAAVCVTLTGTPGDLLTLLPISDDAEGVRTEGLLYPLADETLVFAHTRGVSNVFETEQVRIWLRRGLLWVIHVQAENT